MPWFRINSFLFACWAVLFGGFPHWTNSLAAIGSEAGKHADDWTLLFGLACLGFAVLLDQAHRSANDVARRIVARGVVAFTLPCALIMSYWQIIPDRRWTRFDILNITFLFLISFVMFAASRVQKSETSEKQPQQ